MVLGTEPWPTTKIWTHRSGGTPVGDCTSPGPPKGPESSIQSLQGAYGLRENHTYKSLHTCCAFALFSLHQDISVRCVRHDRSLKHSATGSSFQHFDYNQALIYCHDTYAYIDFGYTCLRSRESYCNKRSLHPVSHQSQDHQPSKDTRTFNEPYQFIRHDPSYKKD